ncbi:MAG: hypothetical protein AAB223_06405, partial [Pseudomonadota bacterium]
AGPRKINSSKKSTPSTTAARLSMGRNDAGSERPAQLSRAGGRKDRRLAPSRTEQPSHVTGQFFYAWPGIFSPPPRICAGRPMKNNPHDL